MEAKSNGSFCPWVIWGKVVPKPGLAGKFMPVLIMSGLSSHRTGKKETGGNVRMQKTNHCHFPPLFGRLGR